MVVARACARRIRIGGGGGTGSNAGDTSGCAADFDAAFGTGVGCGAGDASNGTVSCDGCSSVLAATVAGDDGCCVAVSKIVRSVARGGTSATVANGSDNASGGAGDAGACIGFPCASTGCADGAGGRSIGSCSGAGDGSGTTVASASDTDAVDASCKDVSSAGPCRGRGSGGGASTDSVGGSVGLGIGSAVGDCGAVVIGTTDCAAGGANGRFGVGRAKGASGCPVGSSSSAC